MSVVIDGTTGITAAAFDGALDGADLTGSVAASLLTGDVAAARITTALNATGSAPIYACRAWVNFNGTGTVAIRASGNVSSITDLGVGRYQVNFTTAMPDANFSAVASTGNNENGAYSLATTSVNVYCNDASGFAQDSDTVCLAVFR